MAEAEATESASTPGGVSAKHVVALVDFDNVFPRTSTDVTREWLAHEVNRIIEEASAVAPAVSRLDIRLYGGWLEDGLFTKHASAVQAAAAAVSFPIRKPGTSATLLRGSIDLVTRLVAAPKVEWGHTQRVRDGLPRLRLVDSPLPQDCQGEIGTCPLRSVHRFTVRGSKTCHVDGCTVQNRNAFKVVEQKMVDSLICCDLLALAMNPEPPAILLFSDDLDVLPGIVMAAAVSSAEIYLVRGPGRPETSYGDALEMLGVGVRGWEAA